MNVDLLKELRCPETRQALELAGAGLLDRLNALAERGELVNRGGRPVAPPLEAGLVRSDGQVLYPVRHGIPVMLVEESVALRDEAEGESEVAGA